MFILAFAIKTSDGSLISVYFIFAVNTALFNGLVDGSTTWNPLILGPRLSNLSMAAKGETSRDVTKELTIRKGRIPPLPFCYSRRKVRKNKEGKNEMRPTRITNMPPGIGSEEGVQSDADSVRRGRRK